jgi:hypothetical protein
MLRVYSMDQKQYKENIYAIQLLRRLSEISKKRKLNIGEIRFQNDALEVLERNHASNN